jgi:hypothetical protein
MSIRKTADKQFKGDTDRQTDRQHDASLKQQYNHYILDFQQNIRYDGPENSKFVITDIRDFDLS